MQRVFYPKGTKLGEEIFSLIPNTEAIAYEIKDLSRLNNEVGDCLIANTRLPINKDTILEFSGFKGFGSVSSGVDHVDFEVLKLYGRDFINAPGCNARSVAEFVWFGYEQLIIESMSKIAYKDYTSSGISWGIVGMGNVGSELVKILNHKKISYKFYDPYIVHSSSFEEVISQPVVSIHVPLTFKGEHPTIGFIHQGLEKLCKTDFANDDLKKFLINDYAEDALGKNNYNGNSGKKIIINTSRGEVITYECLKNLLRNDKILGILDVFSPEPPDTHLVEILLTRRDWIYTPHIAGYSQEGRGLGTYIVAKKLAERIGEAYPIAFQEFVKSGLEWRSWDFIRKESDQLVDSWVLGDTEYFERRRNDYPLREDAGFFG